MCIVLLLALATPTHAAITARVTYQTHAEYLALGNKAPGEIMFLRSDVSPSNGTEVVANNNNARLILSGNVTNTIVNLGSTAGYFTANYNHAEWAQAMGCTISPITFFTSRYLTDGQTIDITITCTVPPPTVASLSPTSGLAAGGTGITITGTNFTGATGVKFGANAASNVIVASPTKITATAPAGNGQVDVTVTTGSGTSATSASSKFTYVAAPTLTGVSPSAGSTGGGASVTLTGTNLTGATAVKFDGTAAAAYTVNNATTIIATTPAHAAGAVNVAVTTPGGTATLTNGYTYALPAPTAGAVSATVAANSSANPITLNLSGGAATSVAVFSGASHGTATASGTSITYTPTAGYSGADSFAYTATNASGTSAPATVTLTVSAPTLAVTPVSLSGGTVGTAYSATVSASGGTALYSYAITAGSLPAGLSLSPSGALSGTPSASGTSNFTVTATDANGATGSRTYSIVVVAPVTAPGAPTIGTATAGDRQASVTFTAPVSNGGSAITTYTATANPGGAFGTCAGPAACTATVTGLTNGTAYTFSVTASNAIGTSVASGPSNSATPKGNQTITFPNPGAQNFGTTPNLSSTASATSSLTVAFTSSTSGVCTITSGGALTFVTAGSCTIDADQAGNTTWNAATTVTQTFTVNAIVPGAPTIGTATAGDTEATVTFTAPASTGGAAIIASGYTVTANPGGATGTGSSSPITVTGLTNGTAYTFTVTATNSAGTGAASSVSNSATPKGNQTITFANPNTQSFGTTPTLTATAPGGAVTFSSAATGVCTITSDGALTLVATGSCTINASQAGNAAYLPATFSQTFAVNAVVPGAPTIGTATAGDAQASVAFTAPAFTGGAAITGYTIISSPAGGSGSCAALPATACTVTGLTNGTAYTFTVAAVNSVGTGAASAPSNSVTPAGLPITGVCGSANAVAASAAPSASLCSTGTPSSVTSATTTFSWDCAGSNGGTTAQCSAPRQYQVTASAGANGSITPAGVQTVAYNATPSFTLTPAALYRIDSVSGCGGTLVGSTYTTGAVAASCSVSASFALITHTITATAQPSAGGSVTCTPSTVGEGDSTTCTATASTGTGYVFQKWTGACAGQAAACNLTNVTAPQDSAALFVQEATGLVVPEGVKQGEALALTLQPSAANWVIQSASTATVASTGTSGPSGLQLPYGLVKLTLDTGTAGSSATVVLTYPQALPLGTKYYKFGKTAAKPTTDHWYEFSGAVISGNTITLTLTDGGDGDNDRTANSAIDDPGGPAVVTAPPPPSPPPSLVQLQVTISGAGTVQRSVAGSVVSTSGNTTTVEYVEGQSVTLTPQPQAGARFSGWSGACSGLLPCYLTLRSHQTVQATFTAAAVGCRSNAFSAHEERVLGAYLAYYGRPADVGGLAYWATYLAGERGQIAAIIDAFGQSAEFQQRFGQLSNKQLIANLYQQMYAREPDAAGAAFFESQLAAGRSSLAAIAIHIFDGRQGSDSAVVDNRKKVVRHFVTRFEELGSAAPTVDDGDALARFLSAVNGDEASALAGCARVDAFFDKAAP